MERLSEAQVTQLTRRISEVLQVVPNGATIAIEGTPINLDRFWGWEHSFGYNYLLALGVKALQDRLCSIEHVVLLDDYTIEATVSPQDYIPRIQTQIDRVELESSFVPRANELVHQIGPRLTRTDGRPIDLVTRSGRFCCPLLDAAFQESKCVDFNILIHPIEYKHEQDEMRTILKAARRGSLPFTLVNLFFKGTEVNKVFVIEPEGRIDRVL